MIRLHVYTRILANISPIPAEYCIMLHTWRIHVEIIGARGGIRSAKSPHTTTAAATIANDSKMFK